VTVPAGSSGATLTECVHNVPLNGLYYFGVDFQNLSGSGTVICQIDFYSGFDCNGNTLLDNETKPPASQEGWQKLTPEAALTPIAGGNSVRFDCILGSDATYNFDKFYVTKDLDGY